MIPENFSTEEEGELTPVQKAVLKNVQETFSKLLSEIPLDNPAPEVVFPKAIAALDRAEEVRFVIENLLESIKKEVSPSLEVLIQRYNNLGLTDIKLPGTND